MLHPAKFAVATTVGQGTEHRSAVDAEALVPYRAAGKSLVQNKTQASNGLATRVLCNPRNLCRRQRLSQLARAIEKRTCDAGAGGRA